MRIARIRCKECGEFVGFVDRTEDGALTVARVSRKLNKDAANRRFEKQASSDWNLTCFNCASMLVLNSSKFIAAAKTFDEKGKVSTVKLEILRRHPGPM